MRNIMIFGGTTEGRRLAEFCAANPIKAYISVTSDYGVNLLPESEYLTLLCDKMDAAGMERFFISHAITHVIDATHPFAKEVTENVKQVCDALGISYFRVIREQEEELRGIRYFDNLDMLTDYLDGTAGRIFITTGSKEAAAFCRLKDFESRCVLRVLDVPEIVGRLKQMGYCGEQIISVRGPFSVEENISHFEKYHARYLVTKDSGNAGGFMEKLEAAKACGLEALVLRRQPEQGYKVEQIYDWLAEGKMGKKTGEAYG